MTRYRSVLAYSLDVDPIAVERLCAGDWPARFTVAERAAAVARLRGWGLNARQIAVRLGVTQRTVQRYEAGKQMWARNPQALSTDVEAA